MLCPYRDAPCVTTECSQWVIENGMVGCSYWVLAKVCARTMIKSRKPFIPPGGSLNKTAVSPKS